MVKIFPTGPDDVTELVEDVQMFVLDDYDLEFDHSVTIGIDSASINPVDISVSSTSGDAVLNILDDGMNKNFLYNTIISCYNL